MEDGARSPYRTADVPVLSTFPLETDLARVVGSSLIAVLGAGLVGVIVLASVRWGRPPTLFYVFGVLGIALAAIGVREARAAVLPKGAELRVLAGRLELPERWGGSISLEGIVVHFAEERSGAVVVIGVIPIPVSRTHVTLRLHRPDGKPIEIPAGMFGSVEACAEAAACIHRAQRTCTCGTENALDSAFCKRCGTRLRG